jgi:hypothetical protein
MILKLRHASAPGNRVIPVCAHAHGSLLAGPDGELGARRSPGDCVNRAGRIERLIERAMLPVVHRPVVMSSGEPDQAPHARNCRGHVMLRHGPPVPAGNLTDGPQSSCQMVVGLPVLLQNPRHDGCIRIEQRGNRTHAAIRVFVGFTAKISRHSGVVTNYEDRTKGRVLLPDFSGPQRVARSASMLFRFARA